MEPTIFELRLEFKPRLKFFKFGLSSLKIYLYQVKWVFEQLKNAAVNVFILTDFKYLTS